MPIFALANGGVTITAEASALFAHSLPLGICLGLLVGKPLGICLGAWAVVKSGFSTLPNHLQWRQIIGLGFMGGIGFTMAIFIATLAFSEPLILAETKLAILLASSLSAVVGLGFLFTTPNTTNKPAEPRV